MSKYVPNGYSETNDSFVNIIVWAPDFKGGGLTFDEAFSELANGIDSVINKAKNPAAIELLVRCKNEVTAVRELFLENTSGNTENRKAARHRLQKAYYDLYKKAGQVLKPGNEIGPDDTV